MVAIAAGVSARHCTYMPDGEIDLSIDYGGNLAPVDRLPIDTWAL